MRKLLTLALTLLFILPAAGQTRSGSGSVRDRLIGAWRLVSSEEPGPDGKLLTAATVGTIMYTRDGHMAVQIQSADQSARSAAGPIQYAQGGYEAYFGTYTVDEKSGTVTHHVEGALVKTLVGKQLTRVYTFSGRRLILHSSRQDEHWRVTWEHY